MKVRKIYAIPLLMFTEATDPLVKPPELYTIIENFCLGSRRLELFGSARNCRRGWLTIGTDVAPPPSVKLEDATETLDAEAEAAAEWLRPRPYVKEVYDAFFDTSSDGQGIVAVPNTPGQGFAAVLYVRLLNARAR